MNLLTSHFNHQLIAAGFPDNLHIEWSLGYCQGDGVAFYGALSFDDLVLLHQKLYPKARRQQRMFTRLVKAIEEWDYNEEFEISRNSFGYHYSHWNTMTLTICSADTLRFFDEGKKDWYFPATNKARYTTLWDNFIGDLETYIKTVSCQLEKEGYSILDATPYASQVAYQFETANYQVELLTNPTDLNYFDDEEGQWLCQEVLRANLQFADLSVEIKDKKTGIVLGSESYGYVTYPEKDHSFAGVRYELIREAIRDARSQYGLIARQATLMQKQLIHC